MNHRCSAAACGWLLALALAGCTPGRITDAPRAGAPGDTVVAPDTSVVQRGSLSVHLAIDDTADAAIAAAAGVSVAGLTVTLTRDGTSAAPLTSVADAQGNATFAHLLPAWYQVTVERPLTGTELGRLAPADREAAVFAGGTTLYIPPHANVLYLPLVGSRRGSLVVSEVGYHRAQINGCGGCGSYGVYLEFYNNSDTTIYMDGMLLFQSSGVLTAGTTPWAVPSFSCSVHEAKRIDSTGIWANWIERFPGTGIDFPVKPGEARVWALDAVDLSSLGLLDLRGASFEDVGNYGDPDNPSAANMINLTTHGRDTHGWGLVFMSTVVGIALPVATDTTQFERTELLGDPNDPSLIMSSFKIPRAAILDVILGDVPDAVEMAGYPYQHGFRICEPGTSPVFDRAVAKMFDTAEPRAVRRRTLGRTAAGAEILQRTRTSARDLEYQSPLLRSLFKGR